jgi:hypothetical protein
MSATIVSLYSKEKQKRVISALYNRMQSMSHEQLVEEFKHLLKVLYRWRMLRHWNPPPFTKEHKIPEFSLVLNTVREMLGVDENGELLSDQNNSGQPVCPTCGAKIESPKPKKPRPWEKGDWAKPKNIGFYYDLGSTPRTVVSISSFPADVLFLHGSDLAWPREEFIRTDGHGNPDPEQPEN